MDGRLGFMTAAPVQYLMLCVAPSHGERQVSDLEKPPELLIAVYGVWSVFTITVSFDLPQIL